VPKTRRILVLFVGY